MMREIRFMANAFLSPRPCIERGIVGVLARKVDLDLRATRRYLDPTFDRVGSGHVAAIDTVAQRPP
jgi:hypothetical protein